MTGLSVSTIVDDYGRLHCASGPAITYEDGEEGWFWRGGYHRIGGPARTFPDGSFDYYVNDERHREDGPAAKHSDGTFTWWINGKMLPNNEINKWIKENNISIPLTGDDLLEFNMRWR